MKYRNLKNRPSLTGEFTKFSLLVLTSVLSLNFAIAQDETKVEKFHSNEGTITIIGEKVVKEDKKADGAVHEDKADEALPVHESKPQPQEAEVAQLAYIGRAPAVKPKSLDEIEAEANKLARNAKLQEEKSKKLQEKSQKLARKSDKLEQKSDQFEGKSGELAEVSVKLSEQSKELADESKRLSDEVEASEDNANRDGSIRQMCSKKISKRNMLKILDRRSEEDKMNDCIADYKQGDLKDKIKIKKEYFGKQCTFNPGVSIECPEGTYKFLGSNGLDIVNDQERGEKKEVEVAAADESPSASASQK